MEVEKLWVLVYVFFLATACNVVAGFGLFGRWSMWAIAVEVVGLVPVAVWARGYRRRDVWEDTGRCRTCGYDLRATVDRCPECGTVSGQNRG